MTNAELIAKIKAEIERRITDNTFGAKLELIDILAWLDTLESEKPMNLEGLEKEIEEYFPESTFNTGFNYDDLQEIARHFAEWGAEHLKK